MCHNNPPEWRSESVGPWYFLVPTAGRCVFEKDLSRSSKIDKI